MIKSFGKDFENLLEEGELNNEGESDNGRSKIIYIDSYKITPGPWQSRKKFDQKELEELSTSLKLHGVLQPIIVKKDLHHEDEYQIIAGERRWRAASIAGLSKIPVIIKEISDEGCMALCLIENIQRKDLTIIEEAESYKKLIYEIGLTHEDIGRRVGKSRSHITNSVRCLSLPEEIKSRLNEEEITFGHAKVLLPLDESLQIKYSNEIVANKLSVRDLENKIKTTYKRRDFFKEKKTKSLNARNLEEIISDLINEDVEVVCSSSKTKKIVLPSERLIEKFLMLLNRV